MASDEEQDESYAGKCIRIVIHPKQNPQAANPLTVSREDANLANNNAKYSQTSSFPRQSHCWLELELYLFGYYLLLIECSQCISLHAK